MKSLSRVACLSLILSLPLGLRTSAQTIYTVGPFPMTSSPTPQMPVGWTSSVSFPRFDPSLGTLHGARFEFDIGGMVGATFENNTTNHTDILTPHEYDSYCYIEFLNPDDGNIHHIRGGYSLSLAPGQSVTFPVNYY